MSKSNVVFCGVFVALAALAGCTASTSSTEMLGRQASAIITPGTVQCLFQDDGVGMHWISPAGSYSSTQNLVLALKNNRSTSVTYAMTSVGRGLDGTDVTRVIGNVTVDPASTLNVSVPVGNLPVQSQGTQSSVTLRATFTDQGNSRSVESPPLSYAFDAAYGTATVYGEFGAPVEPTDAIGYFGADATGHANVTTTSFGNFIADQTTMGDVAGRTWNDALGGWVTYAPPTSGLQRGATVVASGDFGQIAYDAIQGMGIVHPGGALGHICVRQRVAFGDDGIGATPEAVRATNGRLPARYARMALFSAATPTTPIFSDYLDETVESRRSRNATP